MVKPFRFEDFRFSCAAIIPVALLNSFILSRMNMAKQRYRSEILAPYIDQKNPDGGVRAWTDLGDRHPDFVYML